MSLYDPVRHAHVCTEDCHRPGGPLTHDENGHSIVSEEPADPLVIFDDHGNLIFRLRGDGVAELPDPAKVKQAAAIFWREVLNMAKLMRIPVAIVGTEDRKPVVR